MNNEIKTILADLNLNVYETKEWKEPLGLNQRTWKTLLDYITNLQQENERLKEENKYLDELRNANYLSWQDSLSRIEKATNKVQDIIDIGFDYDGYNDVDNLKILVDELVDLARQTKNILNGKE